MHGVAERAALGNRERRRLLQVDVLARRDRLDGDQRMPMVRRADDDSIDVLIGQEIAVVAVAGDAIVRLARDLRVLAVDQRLRVLDALAVEVADRDHPRRLMLPDPGQVVPARNPPHADRADVDPVRGSMGAEDRRRHDRGEAGGDGGREDRLSGRGHEFAPRAAFRHRCHAPSTAACLPDK
jgi:hypothetical protein